LKILAEPTERKKQNVRNALPKWGVDFLGVGILVWGPKSRNDGGVHIAFTHSFPRHTLWSIRLDPDLILWTCSHFNKWKNVYNWQPFLDFEIADDFDDDDDDDDDEEMLPVAAAAVAPPALPPPGPGRIDYYFQPRAL
jgi:hypothetical protein